MTHREDKTNESRATVDNYYSRTCVQDGKREAWKTSRTLGCAVRGPLAAAMARDENSDARVLSHSRGCRIITSLISNLRIALTRVAFGSRFWEARRKKKQLCVCAVASKIADPSDPVQKICLAVQKLFLSDKKCSCSKLQLLVYLASRVPVYRLADFPSANSIPRR